jgi:alpha 1,2-mannosyltransferase
MLLTPSRLGSGGLKIAAVLFAVGTAVLFFFHQHYNFPLPVPGAHFSSGQHGNTTASAPVNATEALISFWKDLASTLEKARPQAAVIPTPEGNPTDNYTSWQPLVVNRPRPERLQLTDDDEKKLFRAHHLMRHHALRLGPSLPFAKDKMGIVTTAGSKYVSIFLVSLRMLRRTGCTLPVEIFLDNWKEYNETICEEVFPSLNARCVVMSDIYEQAKDAVPPDHFQFKIFSILFSSFQHVLFLDADAFPVQDPTDLFTTKPYTAHGMVLWPDIWASTVSAHYYHIAALPELPVSYRRTAESGQLMIDKEVHRASLMMMVYYNYYGPDYYYPLLCQNSHGAGDKETFIPAAMALDAPYYQVKRGLKAIGHSKKGVFKLVGMAQIDPKADFVYGSPHPHHLHDSDEWHAEDLTDSSLQEPPYPKPVIIHNNFHKLEPSKILRKDGPARDENNKYQRMYGSLQGVQELFGYDVERRLWESIAEEGCRTNEEVCVQLKEYYREVFESQDKVGDENRSTDPSCVDPEKWKAQGKEGCMGSWKN